MKPNKSLLFSRRLNIMTGTGNIGFNGDIGSKYVADFLENTKKTDERKDKKKLAGEVSDLTGGSIGTDAALEAINKSESSIEEIRNFLHEAGDRFKKEDIKEIKGQYGRLWEAFTDAAGGENELEESMMGQKEEVQQGSPAGQPAGGGTGGGEGDYVGVGKKLDEFQGKIEELKAKAEDAGEKKDKGGTSQEKFDKVQDASRNKVEHAGTVGERGSIRGHIDGVREGSTTTTRKIHEGEIKEQREKQAKPLKVAKDEGLNYKDKGGDVEGSQTQVPAGAGSAGGMVAGVGGGMTSGPSSSMPKMTPTASTPKISDSEGGSKFGGGKLTYTVGKGRDALENAKSGIDSEINSESTAQKKEDVAGQKGEASAQTGKHKEDVTVKKAGAGAADELVKGQEVTGKHFTNLTDHVRKMMGIGSKLDQIAAQYKEKAYGRAMEAKANEAKADQNMGIAEGIATALELAAAAAAATPGGQGQAAALLAKAKMIIDIATKLLKAAQDKRKDEEANFNRTADEKDKAEYMKAQQELTQQAAIESQQMQKEQMNAALGMRDQILNSLFKSEAGVQQQEEKVKAGEEEITGIEIQQTEKEKALFRDREKVVMALREEEKASEAKEGDERKVEGSDESAEAGEEKVKTGETKTIEFEAYDPDKVNVDSSGKSDQKSSSGYGQPQAKMNGSGVVRRDAGHDKKNTGMGTVDVK